MEETLTELLVATTGDHPTVERLALTGPAGSAPALAGLPDEALPAVVPPGPVGTTDAACCAGLRVPLLLLPA